MHFLCISPVTAESGRKKNKTTTMQPYIPTTDAAFAAWLLNFSTLLTAAPATYGLTAPDAVVVAAANSDFQPKYLAATNPTTRTAGTVAAKDASRASGEAIVRPYAIRISVNAAVTAQAKINIGVTVRGAVPTPVPPPTTAPSLSIQSAISGAITLKYSEPGTAGKAKPAGVVGMEIFRSLGTTFATDPSQASYVATATKSPVVIPNEPADAGKKATYYARWTTRSGPGGIAQVGPWTPPLQTYAL